MRTARNAWGWVLGGCVVIACSSASDDDESYDMDAGTSGASAGRSAGGAGAGGMGRAGSAGIAGMRMAEGGEASAGAPTGGGDLGGRGGGMAGATDGGTGGDAPVQGGAGATSGGGADQGGAGTGGEAGATGGSGGGVDFGGAGQGAEAGAGGSCASPDCAEPICPEQASYIVVLDGTLTDCRGQELGAETTVRVNLSDESLEITGEPLSGGENFWKVYPLISRTNTSLTFQLGHPDYSQSNIECGYADWADDTGGIVTIQIDCVADTATIDAHCVADMSANGCYPDQDEIWRGTGARIAD